MELSLNERWIQFAFINSKGKLNKTALKMPMLTDLELNKEYDFTFAGQQSTFTVEAKEFQNNNDGTYDVIYVIATTNI